MTRFIRCDDGTLINDRYVQRITPKYVGESDKSGMLPGSISHYAAVMDNGTQYKVPSWAINPGDFGAVYLPASPGAKAFAVFVDDEDGPEIVVGRWLPIIGWKIEEGTDISADPVFIETLCSNELVFLEMPDGGLIWKNEGRVDTVDEAKAWALREYINQKACSAAIRARKGEPA